MATPARAGAPAAASAAGSGAGAAAGGAGAGAGAAAGGHRPPPPPTGGSGGSGGSRPPSPGLFDREIRFINIAADMPRQEVRTLLREGDVDLTEGQISSILKHLGSGRVDQVTIKKMSDGTVHLALERAGYVSGFQRMSFKISETGATLRVVQTAFDEREQLIPQRPGESKDNLYDVKY